MYDRLDTQSERNAEIEEFRDWMTNTSNGPTGINEVFGRVNYEFDDFPDRDLYDLEYSDSPYRHHIGKQAFISWEAVKTWEVVSTYGLQDLADEMWGGLTTPAPWEGAGNPLRVLGSRPSDDAPYFWPSDQSIVFDLAPHKHGDESFPDEGSYGPPGTPLLQQYFSTAWYDVQLILSRGLAGMQSNNGGGPIDWAYQDGLLQNLESTSGVSNFWRALRTRAIGMQTHNNFWMMRREQSGGMACHCGQHPKESNFFELFGFHPSQDGTQWSGDDAQDQALARTAVQELINELFEFRASVDVSEWSREGDGYEDASYVPTAYSGDYYFNNYTWADNTYRLLPLLEAWGSRESLINDIAVWGESMWPNGNWEQWFTGADDPPETTIISPTNGEVFVAPASFSIVADVLPGDAPVDRVEFYMDGDPVGVDNTADPYSVALTSVGVGAYTLTATAFDTNGLPGSSVPVAVSVEMPGTLPPNATLTRAGAKTGVITTRGVRDALEMRRGIRERQYDNRYQNVVPLVPRRRRLAVKGRLDYAGAELETLDLHEVRAAAQQLAADGVEAVALCFMNSFANPAHERAAAEVIAAELPEAYLSVSSDVLPTVRFYDRVSTTALNAYVGPILRRYLNSLTTKLDEVGFDGVLLIMQSNGGVAVPEVTLERPATTLLSGPAAGPCAAAAYTRPHGHDDCIVVDMGGTSFDASLVRDGVAAMDSEGQIDRLRIALPMLAITTIGAGGGSIGWIDEGGLLRMGPASAGAMPGPACYGRGGTEPTCTDANLVLGYLDPARFAGGRLELSSALAQGAIRERLAEPLGIDVEQAAVGMYRVINSNMAHGVREITVKRGLDPREFPMVVAGGAGSLHACMIANELDMPTLVVPETASVLCAAGMLLSDLQHDFVRSYVSRFESLDYERLDDLIAEMTAEGRRQLELERVPKDRVSEQVSLDLRYVKQYHEVTVAVDAAAIASRDVAAIAGAFHREHDRLYGYNLAVEGTDLELINVRVRAIGTAEKPVLPTTPAGGPDSAGARRGKRRAYLPESGTFGDIDVYDGHALMAGNVVWGPALIERTDTTILVTESFVATLDERGSYLLEKGKE